MNLSNFVGETSNHEKKLMLEENKPKSWLKSVSAFANTNGGKIIFGVDNDDILIGIQDTKRDCEKISEIMKTRLDPIARTNLEIFKSDDKEFIVLTIYSGDETPYNIIEGWGRIAYTRIGNQSVVANSMELRNLVVKSMHKTFDSTNTRIPKDRASFSKLKSVYYKRTGNDLTENDLLSFGIIDNNECLTYAGALLADEHLVYQSRIFATRWNGVDKSNSRLEALDDKEIEGGLLQLLQSGEDFIKLNSKKMWKKGAKYRMEYPDYPERAIQEALVNALIHRDYNIIGSEIHIDMYDDRLEIYSPGGMIDGSFIHDQNPYKISSKRRNPVIADIFSRMSLMERRGSGLKKILDTYESQDKYEEYLRPEFRSTQSSFFIILKNLNYKNEDINNISNKKEADFSTKINERVTDQDSNQNAEKFSEKIQNEKMIKKSKQKDKVKAFLSISHINKKSSKVLLSNQENLVLKFAKRKKSFQTKHIEHLLGIKSSRARSVISKMIEKNILEGIGEKKNKEYKLKNVSSKQG
ncbi:ATP-binding protein [Mycoplasma sp. Ms02]|uniref:ATP-binding protein n=1 Tax=Mycoplasma sp. Ms02 TaxID=353851 RepID=UPI001C89EA42|nr:ATP-binding protein [Mycoplasma sp. Ms02]QZE12572.1 putative DNA binding domain-containing protein [Mycoplasma sp. Ms02]